MAKYIFVTGGVVSGLGKGVTVASLGRLLKARGYKVVMQKFDPYINVDPGTISPYQHGEVFVTDDGAETDLDLGHYERFSDENLNVYSSVTAGKIYWSVLNKERNGEYNGATVQVIPHITNEIKQRAYILGKNTNSDVVITEIGGTVGDIELQPFLEAARQVRIEAGRNNCLFVHLTLVPYIGELKSKPTQHSVKELLSTGIHPDVIVCRVDRELTNDIKQKISLFCNVDVGCVIPNMTASSIYEVPLMLEAGGLGKCVCEGLGLDDTIPDLDEWRAINDKIKKIDETERAVTIALVGKYVELRDSYLSIAEALFHGGIENEVNVNIEWIQAEHLTKENVSGILGKVHGILVPGGAGERGTEGKILAAAYARENSIPFFGIGMGMQLAIVEFARNVVGLTNANSTEICTDTEYPVIDIMPERKNTGKSEKDMRLGLYPCKIAAETKLHQVYGEELVYERHCHRYEVNNEYKSQLVSHGLIFSGMSPDEKLCETIELDALTHPHPWFIGVQFHPEFKSRPNRAHPLFTDFVRAADRR